MKNRELVFPIIVGTVAWYLGKKVRQLSHLERERMRYNLVTEGSTRLAKDQNVPNPEENGPGPQAIECF